MYIYICMYTYIYIHTRNVCIHVICAYIYICIFTSMYIGVSIFYMGTCTICVYICREKGRKSSECGLGGILPVRIPDLSGPQQLRAPSPQGKAAEIRHQ